MWYKIIKDELLIKAGRLYLDKYINIKAATNLLILYINNTSVSIAKP